MSRRTILIILSAAVAALVIAGTVVWMNATSYDDTVAACANALEHRAEGDKAKPDACKDVKSDDYDTLVVGQVLKDSGVVDEDGNVDLRRLADDPSMQP